MTHHPINLHEIDFSQHNGEFIYKEETYQLKEYSNYYFFRNKKHVNHEFIYSFDSHGQYCLRKYSRPSPLDLAQTLLTQENPDGWVQRCVQYKEELFSFGDDSRGQYYSPKDNTWIALKYLKCNKIKKISIDEVLKKPYAFFVERVVSVYEQELPLIKDEKKFDSFMQETTKPIEFIRGSEAELEKLTKLAAFILPKTKLEAILGERHLVLYQSKNDYRNGGVRGYDEDDFDIDKSIYQSKNDYDWELEKKIYKQNEQLFNLIFKYNCFSGLYWSCRGNLSPIDKYTNYYHAPHYIDVWVKSPSQHERMEAVLELERWLKGKLPEEEIRAYFEW